MCLLKIKSVEVLISVLARGILTVSSEDIGKQHRLRSKLAHDSNIVGYSFSGRRPMSRATEENNSRVGLILEEIIDQGSSPIPQRKSIFRSSPLIPEGDV